MHHLGRYRAWARTSCVLHSSSASPAASLSLSEVKYQLAQPRRCHCTVQCGKLRLRMKWRLVRQNNIRSWSHTPQAPDRWNSPDFPPDLYSICTCSIFASFVTAFTMSMTVSPATAAPAVRAEAGGGGVAGWMEVELRAAKRGQLAA